MTSQKINYAPEVDKVCKALEASQCLADGGGFKKAVVALMEATWDKSVCPRQMWHFMWLMLTDGVSARLVLSFTYKRDRE
ncbi:hypothetical protein T459_32809 [Capsicum annuum]|uniref:Uncharacterized protein n=1 Tax=Capsicum annuum TaxID=4072 RepID=A0A2G2Y0R5_CAPAN|nr:hypothetical protein T459_32809 [Capsicum annuum]